MSLVVKDLKGSCKLAERGQGALVFPQPTAGANGNVNSFSLPGNYIIRFTGMKVKLHDGGQMFNVGIQPDVFVNQTIAGVSAGKDEYLEKALEIIKQGI